LLYSHEIFGSLWACLQQITNVRCVYAPGICMPKLNFLAFIVPLISTDGQAGGRTWTDRTRTFSCSIRAVFSVIQLGLGIHRCISKFSWRNIARLQISTSSEYWW